MSPYFVVGFEQDRCVSGATGSRYRQFSDEQWERVEPVLASSDGKVGRPFADHRRVVEGICYRYRTGIAWRDLPREQFGSLSSCLCKWSGFRWFGGIVRGSGGRAR